MKQLFLLVCILFVNLLAAEISEDDLTKIKEFHTTVNIVAKSFEEVDLPNLPSKLKDIHSQIDFINKSSIESDKNLSKNIDQLTIKINSIEKNLNQTVDLLNKLSNKFLELESNTKNNSLIIDPVKKNLSTDNSNELLLKITPASKEIEKINTKYKYLLDGEK